MEPGYQPPPLSPIVREPEESVPHKLLIPVLIGLVVILAGTTGLFAYQNERLRHDLALAKIGESNTTAPTTPTPTATQQSNWQTYTDAKSKILLTYPPAMTKDIQSQGPTTTTKLTYIGPTQMASGRTQAELSDGYQITVQVSPLVGTTDLTTWADKNIRAITKEEYGETCQVSPVTTGSISSYTTAEYTATNCRGNFKTILTIANGFTYNITGLYTAPIYSETVNKILSTFTFTQ